jgi:hypothetical protein
LGKRVRLLEDHPDPLPHLDRIDVLPVEVRAVVEDRALDGRRRDEVVHAVEAADEGALAAARWADEGRDEVAIDVERDTGERGHAPIRDGEVSNAEEHLPELRRGYGALALAHGLRSHAGYLDRRALAHGRHHLLW